MKTFGWADWALVAAGFIGTQVWLRAVWWPCRRSLTAWRNEAGRREGGS